MVAHPNESAFRRANPLLLVFIVANEAYIVSVRGSERNKNHRTAVVLDLCVVIDNVLII